MKTKLRRRKSRLANRSDERIGEFRSQAIQPPAIRYELSENQRAVSCGGIGTIMALVKQVDLLKEVDRAAPMFRIHARYDDAGPVLNIACNLLAGGTSLEHLGTRRNDEACLGALDAARIRHPTTAGDFCQPFTEQGLINLMQGINRVRQRVWKQQLDEFRKQASIKADGTTLERHGERKEGLGLSCNGKWGYHSLVVTLAETQGVLYLTNSSGNYPSREDAALYFDLAIKQCKHAGYEEILLRGDTGPSLTESFDGWGDEGIKFVLGMDAMPNLKEIADSLGKTEWKAQRRGKCAAKTCRSRRPNYNEVFVEKKGCQSFRLAGEGYA